MFGKVMLLVLGLLLLPGNASALIRNRDLGEISVKVTGARRSKPVLIESLVGKCMERGGYRSWESLDPGVLGQCLSNSRLFSKVEVEVRQPEIEVRVTERWTLIPIPNVYASNGKRSFGAFVYESNLLGYGKIAGVGGAISTEGNTFSLMYMDPAVLFSDYTFRVLVFRSSTERETYDGSTTIYSYDKVEEGFSLTPGYRITPDLNVSITLRYANNCYSAIEPYAVPGDYRSWSGGAGLSYSDSDYKLFYNDGLRVHLNLLQQLDRSDRDGRIFTASAKVEWDRSVFEGQALQLCLRGIYQSSGSVGDLPAYGLGKGFRGIQPEGLWTSRVVSASADYQVALAGWRHGTVTVAPFVDFGIYDPYFEDNRGNYLAYGIGAYYFMNFINLPGLGLTTGINEKFMGPFISLQLGMGFN